LEPATGGKLESGKPTDPAVFVEDEGRSWAVDDHVIARDGSHWRIVAIDAAPAQLADDGFEAIWIVEPLD
jgi:hypothetical protein